MPRAIVRKPRTPSRPLPQPERDRAATGIAGLDNVLAGGFPRHQLYLIQGDPGAGKTTLGLQFLLEGARTGDRGLYITFSETAEELTRAAGSHGWDLSPVQIHQLSIEEQLKTDAQHTVFPPAEVELLEITQTLLSVVEHFRPARVVIDSLSELRLLAGDPLRYRRQILMLKQQLGHHLCTVLLLDDRPLVSSDLQLESLAHGVVTLQQVAQEFGTERRRLRVQKLRATTYRGGWHDFIIRTGGLDVFPRLVAAEHRLTSSGQTFASGLPELDRLTGGGLLRGTSTLFMGPAGVGKSTVAIQYAVAAAQRKEKTVIYSFDENVHTIMARTEKLGMDLKSHLDSGMIAIRPVDPAELTPGEFVHTVRQAVEQDGVKLIIVDSLNGYLAAMPEERFLTIQLHELLTYLAQRDVSSLMVVSQHGVMGPMDTPIDLSYLSDAILLFRYYEYKGEVRQAISMVKKRSSAHERTIRDLRFEDGRITLGEPLRQLHGVLTGVPVHDDNGLQAAAAAQSRRRPRPS